MRKRVTVCRTALLVLLLGVNTQCTQQHIERPEGEEYVKLVKELEQRRETAAKDANALYSQAGDYWRLPSDLDTAQTLFDRVLKENPDHAESRFDLAQVLEQRGRYAESAAHFRRFLELQSGGRRARKRATEYVRHYDSLRPLAVEEDGWQSEGDTASDGDVRMVRAFAHYGGDAGRATPDPDPPEGFSLSTFRSIKIGDSLDSVKEKLGEPLGQRRGYEYRWGYYDAEAFTISFTFDRDGNVLSSLVAQARDEDF